MFLGERERELLLLGVVVVVVVVVVFFFFFFCVRCTTMVGDVVSIPMVRR
jgi:hypothetical protein